MYLEHFHLTHSPFEEEPNPEIFFPGARREEICQSLLLDILAGKTFLKLIGREGSGKTLMCRLLIDRLPPEYEVVHLDNPVGSFDDLLRIACLDLGMNPLGRHESVNYLEELQQQLEFRRLDNKKVVLLIDEAEKLFLATLERLVRNIGETSENWPLLCVVLSGRPGLDANLEQLAVYCASIDIHAGYTLDPLNENETRQYLRFRLQEAGLRREQQEDVFTEGAVAKIHESAQGNIRMINILAEESLQISYSEKSFLVLLDHVEPESGDEGRVENRILELFDLLRHNRMVAGAVAGAVVLVLALGLLLSGGKKEEKAAPKEIAKQEAQVQKTPSPSPAAEAGKAAGSPEAAKAEPPAAVKESKIEPRDGDKLFRERRGASASWVAAAYRGGFTIQLMMLTADQAQAGLTKMLVQDDYFAVKDQLYILQKKTSPPTLFVFYGMYDSLDAAREARNTMPVFLREHHPYALSISDALKKTEK